jgi:hypothetical protein
MQLLKRAALLAVGLASISSQIYGDDGFKLSEKLSVTGFIDMSYVSKSEDTKSTAKTGSLDQAEIDFMYDFGKGMTAQIDLEAQSSSPATGGGFTTDIEQAFFKYNLTEEFSVKAGRFLSYSGWETEEPTGLFQYSGSGYAPYFYGYYQDGVSLCYSNKLFDVGFSVVDDVFAGGSGNMNDMGYELMLGVHPVDGLTVKGFYMSQEHPTYSETKYNVWASYGVGGFTFAAEYNSGEDISGTGLGKGTDGDGYLFMANYAWEKVGLTLRYNAWKLEKTGLTVEEYDVFTISPSYKVNDNLLLVTEYRMDDANNVAGKNDVDTFALEALISF